MRSYVIQILIFISFKTANSQQNGFVVVSTTPPSQTETQINQRFHQLEERIQKLEQRSQRDLLPRNCQEIKNNASGIYTIKPNDAAGGFMVVCDMETDGGGWTYLLNRFDGSQDFYRGWNEYKYGFGNLAGEFWLGLEHLHQLTGFEINELLVELTDWKMKKIFAHYFAFGVGSEDEGYSLKIVDGYSGDDRDFLKDSAGCRFTTKDRDQDQDGRNCAIYRDAAWWYKTCTESQLTGSYNYVKAHLKKFHYTFKKGRMMIRPRKSKNNFGGNF